MVQESGRHQIYNCKEKSPAADQGTRVHVFILHGHLYTVTPGLLSHLLIV